MDMLLLQFKNFKFITLIVSDDGNVGSMPAPTPLFLYVHAPQNLILASKTQVAVSNSIISTDFRQKHFFPIFLGFARAAQTTLFTFLHMPES